MDGVLVVDKPEGPTSHDVVAAARRLLGQRQIGHTGTLDPLASGVLPLAVGRATRLVRFFAASEKEYDATIRFGVATDSYDITGRETSRTGAVPAHGDLVRAIEGLTGEYAQAPPPFSAKKVGGRRAYALARQERAVTLAAVPVRVSRAELLAFEGDRARISLTCSAGFYVRALAHALGERVGTGACLEALRRTRAGEFTLEAAVTLDDLGDTRRIAGWLVPLDRLLGSWPVVTLTDRGRERAAHGRELDAADYAPADSGLRPPIPDPRLPTPDPRWVRLLDTRGALVAMATTGLRAGSLHPAIVLI